MRSAEFYKSRNISQTAKVLRLLKDKRVASNTELNKICFRYSARIHELRREGYIIVTTSLGDGLYHFHFMGHRENEFDESRDA